LFLGCSLETDRTLEAVKATFQQHARIGHYAILAADYDADEFERRQEAMTRIGIRVLWYMPGQYAEIRALLRALLEATSADTLRRGLAPVPPQSGGGGLGTTPPAPNAADAFELPPALRERIRSGNIIFFLGAAASGTLLGDTFYEDIARNNGVPKFVRTRS